MRKRVDVERELQELAALAAVQLAEQQAEAPRVRQPRVLTREKIQAEHDNAPLFAKLVTVSERPTNRAQCRDAERPCVWIGCRMHLYLDVLANGSIRFNFPGCEPHELIHSCALDIADNGPHELQDIAVLYAMTRGRAQEIVEEALEKLATHDFTEINIDDYDPRG